MSTYPRNSSLVLHAALAVLGVDLARAERPKARVIEPPPKVNPSFEQLLQTQVIVRPPKREDLRRLKQLERAKAKAVKPAGSST